MASCGPAVAIPPWDCCAWFSALPALDCEAALPANADSCADNPDAAIKTRATRRWIRGILWKARNVTQDRIICEAAGLRLLLITQSINVLGEDEETFADAVKTDEGSTHKDLSVDVASDASNLATATGFRLVRQSAAIESLVFCVLDISATPIIRCTINKVSDCFRACCVTQEGHCPLNQI